MSDFFLSREGEKLDSEIDRQKRSLTFEGFFSCSPVNRGPHFYGIISRDKIVGYDTRLTSIFSPKVVVGILFFLIISTFYNID